MFMPYLKTCLQNVKRHVYTFFEDMFTPYLKRCLYHVQEHVYTLFETCLHTIEDIFSPRLNACLHNVLRHNYIMLEYSFTQCLNICFTIFGNMFTQCMKRLYLFTFALCMIMCLHNVSTIFTLHQKTCYKMFVNMFTAC